MKPRDLTWYEPPTPTDEAAVARVEAELGVVFPPDYREFALAFQGGMPRESDVDIDDRRKPTVSVGLFLTMASAGVNSIVETCRALGAQWPTNVVPISMGPGR